MGRSCNVLPVFRFTKH
uniref:Uncharacterized protein n=1 Tax=Zea mays TaxID=4577 RepID=C4J2J7_MAIZE|nr:unknown [Zea mays]